MTIHRITNAEIVPTAVYDALRILDRASFFEGGLLIGSWTFPFYKEIYGAHYPLRTDDVDFAMAEVADGGCRADLEVELKRQGFEDVIDLLSGQQKFVRDFLTLEFIVHRRGDRDALVTVDRYNINAQPLPFIDILFVNPLLVALPDCNIRLPCAEALFLHKLIIAQRRTKESKKEKDLDQCLTLLPYIDTRLVSRIAGLQKFSAKVIRAIRRSAEIIGFSQIDEIFSG